MINSFKIVVTITLIASFKFSSAQSKHNSGPPNLFNEKEKSLQVENANCVHTSNFPLYKRVHFYPFEKAMHVQLVSYKTRDSGYLYAKLPMKHHKVDYSRLKEVISLSKKQIESLTDILYNYGFKGDDHFITHMMCYDPRNAILFVDSTGKAFAFLEICFECHDYRVSSKSIKTGDFCEQKYDLLKAFFRKVGISYGVKSNN